MNDLFNLTDYENVSKYIYDVFNIRVTRRPRRITLTENDSKKLYMSLIPHMTNYYNTKTDVECRAFSVKRCKPTDVIKIYDILYKNTKEYNGTDIIYNGMRGLEFDPDYTYDVHYVGSGRVCGHTGEIDVIYVWITTGTRKYEQAHKPLKDETSIYGNAYKIDPSVKLSKLWKVPVSLIKALKGNKDSVDLTITCVDEYLKYTTVKDREHMIERLVRANVEDKRKLVKCVLDNEILGVSAINLMGAISLSAVSDYIIQCLRNENNNLEENENEGK